MTYMTIPSTISGGPSIFQVRMGSGEVLSVGDEADFLVAFYQHSYQDHFGFFFFSSRRRHTRYWRDWSSDVCSSDLAAGHQTGPGADLRSGIPGLLLWLSASALRA